VAEPLHPIQVVVDQTGLSAHVIRIWEKRYGAVKPTRTESNRRLYSDDQIRRLKLLRQLSETGHGIGYVAKLPTETLARLTQNDAESAVRSGSPRRDADWFLERALAAVPSLDAAALDLVLRQAEVALGGQGVLHRVVAPLARAIGEQWRDGTLTAAHEHFASAVIRLFLSHAARPFAGTAEAPLLVVVTPSGQLHELGALLVAAAAANLGWRVTYLGAGLSAADIAGAVTQSGARAVALSIVYPEDDPQLNVELARLRELLPGTVILAGGRAMSGYSSALQKIGALQVGDLGQFGEILDRLRQRGDANLDGLRRPGAAHSQE
jgi:DNA-binding transcriptional MerR regulator/methylmalonyl-CoA mutase cobalamin-binding subunit